MKKGIYYSVRYRWETAKEFGESKDFCFSKWEDALKKKDELLEKRPKDYYRVVIYTFSHLQGDDYLNDRIEHTEYFD